MPKVFPIEMDDVLHRKLKHAAIDEGLSLHELIVKVLTRYVDSDLNIVGKECEQ